MNIYGKKVCLRALRRDDAEIMVEMFNDPALERCLGGWAWPLSLDQEYKWLDAHMNDSSDRRLIIETPEDGAIGMVSLTNIDMKNRCAEIGIKLADRDIRGKGLGFDAFMAIIRYAFDELGLHRINSDYYDDNEASRAMNLKAGFVEEGLMRECRYFDGRWHNFITAGLLESDYRKKLEETHYWD